MSAPTTIRRPPGTIGRNNPMMPPSRRIHPSATAAIRGGFSTFAVPISGTTDLLFFKFGTVIRSVAEYKWGNRDGSFLGRAQILCSLARKLGFPHRPGLQPLGINHPLAPTRFATVGTSVGPSRRRGTCRRSVSCPPSGPQSSSGGLCIQRRRANVDFRSGEGWPPGC